ncbi:MAG TPA: cystathionine gamma-lyase [Burkholderiaceae bacterium]|nr:cystathionine gamma-lyase [Burkholderiaceae bacterium]
MSRTDLEALFARCMHHGAAELPTGAPLAPPIVPASVYHLPGEPTGTYQYGRWANPTWTALEDALALLEDAHVVTFPSGMAAIAAMAYALLKPGDRVLLPADGYYTIRVLADKYLAPLGVRVQTCPTSAVGESDLTGYKLVLLETPSNPGLDLCDIAAIAPRAKAAGAILAVDNTTMSPLGQRPLDLGADLIVSSDTKSVNGHSDVLFGHVASRDTGLIEAIRDWRRYGGAIPGQFEAWLVHRGLETLEVRFERMCATAATLAPRLEEHAKVVSVRYPGLPSHPAHALARRQMLRFGHMLAVTFADKDAAERFISRCRLVRATTSFGGVHTSAERRARWGDAVSEGFVRLSIGVEPCAALWDDLRQALDGL